MHELVYPAAMMVKLLRVVHNNARVTFLHRRTRRHLAKTPAKIFQRAAILLTIVIKAN